jgi:acetyl esterase/lipase
LSTKAVTPCAAVIIAPGGGYQALANGHEGRQVGDWFAAHGVTAFVLNYRLASAGYRYPVAFHDAQRAIRWVRSHAAEFGIDPKRVGMVGFSAGGHLTAMASTLFDAGDAAAADPVDRASSRPDFAVLAYPCITSIAERDLGLLGPRPDAKTKRALNPALNVRPDTPRTFIFHTATDELVPPAESIAYFGALRAANVSAEMHIFAEGRHGLGFAMTERGLHEWPNLLQSWLDQGGVLAARGQ